MSSTERDTHFAGFAKALLEEIQTAEESLIEQNLHFNAETRQELELLIARRTYDLMYAIIKSYGTPDDIIAFSVEKIPDMPALPEVQECG